MSWLDIFKRKPRVPGSAVGVSFEDDAPTPGKIAYTAREVAEAGVSKAEVEEIVQEVTRRCHEAALQGGESIGYSHENSNLLNHVAKELTRLGYEVSSSPGFRDFNPEISISWEHP